jgi:hypothetical protein
MADRSVRDEAGATVVELWARRLRGSDPEGGRMATEYLQFAGALVFFLAILIESYWFVYVPLSPQSDEDRHLEEEKRL